MTTVRRLARFARRVMRCGRLLATDRRLPRWLRVLSLIGCVQIPVLPVDEIALGIAVAVLALRYRSLLVSVWAETSPVTVL